MHYQSAECIYGIFKVRERLISSLEWSCLRKHSRDLGLDLQWCLFRDLMGALDLNIPWFYKVSYLLLHREKVNLTRQKFFQVSCNGNAYTEQEEEFLHTNPSHHFQNCSLEVRKTMVRLFSQVNTGFPFNPLKHVSLSGQYTTTVKDC